MFCPRCGASNTDTVKFCRQCGLPMQPLGAYVASGGTAGLATPPGQPGGQPGGSTHEIDPFTAAWLRPGQPGGQSGGSTGSPSNPLSTLAQGLTPKQKMVLAIVASAMSPAIFGAFGADQLSAISAILVPVLILTSVFYYRNQIKAAKNKLPSAAASVVLSPPSAPALSFNQPRPMEDLAPGGDASPPTNPLKVPKGSVTEDETRRLAE